MDITVIDFAPLLTEYVLPAVGTAIGVLVMWLVRKVTQYFNIKLDDGHRALIHGVVDRGIAMGQQRVAVAVGDHARIDVKNAIVAQAVNYAMTRAPDALKRFGLDKEGLQDMIEAKLSESLVAEAKAFPAPKK